MIGVIADDLTGAAEIGGAGWRHGLRAEIVGSGTPSPDAELVCVDTDSRSATPVEAGRRASDAAERLQGWGAEWIYKKVDSVLRGHVVVELEAILKRLSWDYALLVPANPGRGRIIRGGRYFIGSKPIHETEFGRDPEYPRTSSELTDLLGGSGSESTRIDKVRTRETLTGIVVGEAESAEDLTHWVGRRSARGLMSGAAEFFEALLEAERPGMSTRPDAGPGARTVDGEIFVCGSLSQSTAEFVETERLHGTPVFVLPETPFCAAETDTATLEAFTRRVVGDLQAHSRVVLTTGSTVVVDPEIPHRMARQLIQLTCAMMQATTVTNVHVEGGATAAQLLGQMGWDRLEMVREVAPGIVTLRVSPGEHPLLTLKPGSYTWPEEFWGRSQRGVRR